MHCFSDVGYTRTGIRDIAAAAGVSYTLVGRYFGSKAGLLEAALIERMSIAPVIASDRSRFGEHLAALIIQDLQDAQSMAMTILAAADPDGRVIATRVAEDHVIAPLAQWIGEPNARERAIAITMLGAGFVLYSKHLPLIQRPLDVNHPSVQWLARSLQQVLDDPQ